MSVCHSIPSQGGSGGKGREGAEEREGRGGKTFRVSSLGGSHLTSSTRGQGAAGVLWAALRSLATRRERRAGHLLHREERER